ncbi:MAG: hypothetical protein B7Z62_08760 [Deltaproteobacteria bacterium 37-65-8]|nr:MAG: hypothetical protein B7Z62_08760 [Deltaproteobacteria bacterium 37-65-8]
MAPDLPDPRDPRRSNLRTARGRFPSSARRRPSTEGPGCRRPRSPRPPRARDRPPPGYGSKRISTTSRAARRTPAPRRSNRGEHPRTFGAPAGAVNTARRARRGGSTQRRLERSGDRDVGNERRRRQGGHGRPTSRSGVEAPPRARSDND